MSKKPIELDPQAFEDFRDDFDEFCQKNREIPPPLFVFMTSMFLSDFAFCASPCAGQAYEVMLKGIAAGKEFYDKTEGDEEDEEETEGEDE